LLLAEPPNVLFENYAEQVDEPYERYAEEKNDRKNDSNCVACNQALKKTVNCPNDVKSGDAKNEFYEPRKVIHSFDQIFHFM
jgi:hypothetical protein